MTQQWNHITKSHYTHFAYLLTYSFIFIVKETVADKSFPEIYNREELGHENNFWPFPLKLMKQTPLQVWTKEINTSHVIFYLVLLAGKSEYY